jgi:hypothetical protein
MLKDKGSRRPQKRNSVESGNAEVQSNNIKECMLDTISDLGLHRR